MKPERFDERVTLGTTIAVLLVLWLGFFVHRSPQFAGSAWGGLLGVLAAVLSVAAGAYWLLKRAGRGRGLLRWHVWLGAAAALLAVLHTGHRFDSNLGIALTALMLLVVLSGFAGRHLLVLAGEDERDLRNRLESVRLEYRGLADMPTEGKAQSADALELAAAMADLEYGLAARESLRQALARWRAVHIAASLALLTVLALHIWAALEFGLRWFR